MKKIISLFGIFLFLFVITSCNPVHSDIGTTDDSNETPPPDIPTPDTPIEDITPDPAPAPESNYTDLELTNLSSNGYVKDELPDFTIYENTSAYRQVTTPDELLAAIVDAKCNYKNVWDNTTSSYTQIPADGYTEDTIMGTVRVIEIMNDMNLGYYKLSETAKATGVVEDFCRKNQAAISNYTMSNMFTENGMSQIKVENTTNLLIYSKNGSKLTHCGFKLTSDHNVVFRNLEMDELWQWEDTDTSTISKVGDYDAFGWAYFKISFCGKIWIDHMTFGKSYDGQIDYSNPVYNVNSAVAFRAPYQADGSNGLHISWCNFNAGADDEDGYLYKMMEAIEQDYQAGNLNYLYYKKLRDSNISFEDILYGIAIPQKKGFLCGDSGDDYSYNVKLQISFSNCYFKNLEDRLPKLRGGNAYLFNCIVDSLQYYDYRTKLSNAGAKSLVSSVNSSWKCALVSQGIVCGNGGSVYSENCIYQGIEYLLKNNDSTPSGGTVNGGYQLVNTMYQKSSDSEQTFINYTNDTPTKLSSDNFIWRTEDASKPFEASVVELDNLSNFLKNESYGVGVKSNFNLSFLKTVYSKA